MRKFKVKMTDAVDIKFISFKDTEFCAFTLDGEALYEAIKEYFDNHCELTSQTIVTKTKRNTLNT